MFLRFVRRRYPSGFREYAQIAEKYREDGKQKTKVLKHMGPVNGDEDRRRYGEIFQSELRRERMKDTDMEKLEFDPPLDFGTMYAVRNIMVKTGDLSPLILDSFSCFK